MQKPLNSHGGARGGAGRPRKEPQLLEDIPPTDDPVKFLKSLMNHPHVDARLRLGAAVALMPFIHPKIGEVGKKDAKQDAASKAALGKFTPSTPPLKLVNGYNTKEKP